MKIGKFKVGRDPLGRLNVLWLKTDDRGDVLTMSYGALRPYPPLYVKTLHVTPTAAAQEQDVMATAFMRLWRHALETDKALRAKGKRGLRLERLEFVYTPPGRVRDSWPLADGEPGTEEENHILAWKAYAR